MIRVIIADDENRILQLIVKLIDWKQIGMEIVGTASNGIEALQVIEREDPDVIITDIRMPGYDGLEMIERAKDMNSDLEFIIISGYGEFEYAKKAIEYGVKDYLLKPINKEDLFNTLMKLKDHIKKKREKGRLDKGMKLPIKEDIKMIRQSFLNNLLLYKSEVLEKDTLEEINRRYYFVFQQKIFRAIALKFDFTREYCPDNVNDIMDKVIDSINQSLEKHVCDFEIIKDKSTIYGVLNYTENHKKKIEFEFNNILKEFYKRISASKKIEITIAYGEEVEDLKHIKSSFESAKSSIEDRILKGTGRIIEYGEIISDKIIIEDVFSDFLKKFIKAVELLDVEQVKKVILGFKKDIEQKSLRGVQLKDLIIESAKTYYLVMKSNRIKIDNATIEYNKIESIINNCHSVDNLFNELLEHISESLKLLMKNRSQNNLVQIRQAKKYIEENYMKNITLDDVGSHIGFNPSYFSSLFKKETGTSFTEYLSETRIEKSKDLLRESDLKIQDVCFMVGYNDPKYFAKSFIKHTGLKPKEYRKIFM